MDKIAILIPFFNEEEYIEKVYNSLMQFKIPNEAIVNFFFIDGASNDNSVKILKTLINNNSNIKIINNPKRYPAQGINKVIRSINSDYIMRLDCHSIYPNDYLLNCYKLIKKTKATNVGGVIITKPGGDNFSAKIVQCITTHKFGVGNSSFRTEDKIGETDTVPFGFFNASIFKKIGYFNEKLIRCQDYEFNRRIIKNGGKIYSDSKIYCEYYNQKSFFKFLLKQKNLEGPYNIYMWYLAPYSFAIRHSVTGLFVLGLLLGWISYFIFKPLFYIYLTVLSLYFILSIISSIQLSLRYKDTKLLIILPFCFFLFHFFHGIGLIKGYILLITNKAPIFK